MRNFCYKELKGFENRIRKLVHRNMNSFKISNFGRIFTLTH